ncbi:SagB-type dehydrogenase family enzyme [Curtobacterium sp. PhB78]|nr:SagB-type dehydrogenase family enzyme [Curtobacterium sp. PhB78]
MQGRAAELYARLVVDRVRSGMPSDGWKADWANAPRTVAHHEGAQTILFAPPEQGTGLFGEIEPSVSRAVTDVCASIYGLKRLQLTVNLNDRPEVHTHVAHAKWGRGAASGGGRYCADFYLVHGGDAELRAGVYHFSVIANGWEQLQRHDRTDELRQIQQYTRSAASYLVITIDFWRSAFKYGDFAYQATAMDVGTVFGAEHELLGDGVAGSWDMEVDEEAIAAVLGLDARDNGVYAVQPWGALRDYEVAGAPAEALTTPLPTTPTRHQGDRGRVRFSTTRALQADMRRQLPDVSARERVRPVEPSSGNTDRDRDRARQLLLRRESSFGRFGVSGISLSAVREMLAAALRSANALTAGAAHKPDIFFLVYATRVQGLEKGLYRADADELRLVLSGDEDAFLDSTYFLHNYMGRRAACTVIICAAVQGASRHRGVRGYRLTNAMVGSACQGILNFACEAGIGTGTALGFDPAAHSARSGIDPEEASPMLMIMLGADMPSCGSVHAATNHGGS